MMQNAEICEPDEPHARATSAQPTVSRLVHRQSWKQDSSPGATQDKTLGKRDDPVVQPAALETSISDKKRSSAISDQKPSSSEHAKKDDLNASHHTLLSVKDSSHSDEPETLVQKSKLHTDKSPASLEETIWSIMACFVSLVPLVILATEPMTLTNRLLRWQNIL